MKGILPKVRCLIIAYFDEKKTRSLDLSRVRRHFQKSQADRQTTIFFLKMTLKMDIYSSKFLFYHSDIKSALKNL